MKISDVSVTMFNWKSALWRTGAGSFGGSNFGVPIKSLTELLDQAHQESGRQQ